MGCAAEIVYRRADEYLLIKQLFELSILHSALTPLIRFIFRNLISLLVIAVILAGGRFLLEQGRLLRASNSDVQTLASANASVTVSREKMTSLVTERMAEARTESLQQIDRRIKQVRVTRGPIRRAQG